MGVVTTCQACQNEWTKDPPFPESTEKGHGHVPKRGERCGQQARQSEWIIDPPFPESAGKGHSHMLGEEKGVVSMLACQSEWIINPPFPESAEKGQK